ncbi:MAG: GNAT family N-acetyltransferase [Pseudorhodoplanes sp.]
MRSPKGKSPTLTTRRLTLRAPTAKDAEAFRAILCVPEVTRYSNWPDAPDKTQGARFMTAMAKLHPSGKGCGWIIEVRASKRLIGAIRYNRFDKQAHAGEIGYELHPHFWGKGLMSEALAAIVDYGHDTLLLNRIEAWTLAGNPASDRVLEKTGFRYEGTLRGKMRFKGAYHDLRIFARIVEDPRSIQDVRSQFAMSVESLKTEPGTGPAE